MNRPSSVLQLVFRTGLQIKAELKMSPDEIRAEMNCSPEAKLTLHTVAEGEVYAAPRSRGQEPEALYRVHDEEIHFTRSDVLFYSISKVSEPRKVIGAQVGIARI